MQGVGNVEGGGIDGAIYSCVHKLYMRVLRRVISIWPSQLCGALVSTAQRCDSEGSSSMRRSLHGAAKSGARQTYAAVSPHMHQPTSPAALCSQLPPPLTAAALADDGGSLLVGRQGAGLGLQQSLTTKESGRVRHMVVSYV